ATSALSFPSDAPSLSGLRLVVVGMGRSGRACVRFLARLGARVVAADSRPPGALAEVAAELAERDVPLAAGPHPPELFDGADGVVLSPGVPHTLPVLEAARGRGIPVIGELELAARLATEPIAAVTGTNGKTTVTTLLGEMLRASGQSVFVGGNIGTPLIAHVDDGVPCDRLVVEVSSFQLDTADRFHPDVAVLLNISDDHLDRYPDFDAYARSKGRIFRNMGPRDAGVIPADSPHMDLATKGARCRFLTFRKGGGTPASAFREKGCLRIENGTRSLAIDLTRWTPAGDHNLENLAAAALAALAAGGTPAGIQAAADAFPGLPHRLETVADVGGVRYVNDSKGTNVDAVARALAAFEAPVVLIMGGRGKGGGYEILRPLVSARVRRLVVTGESAAEVAAILGPACAGGVADAPNLEAAVRIAANSARSGDVVLLSPGGSSFDVYESYAERGEDFRRAVRELG
ncbi:MAG: UDP-N-acetylmuramoyl-L-alanine--D-glutamate ligase, partial [Desulfococcaceae bacterium]